MKKKVGFPLLCVNIKMKLLDYHRLRTRKSGNIKLVDFHMTVNEELTVKESHALCEKIEKDLEEIIKNTNVNIHVTGSFK